MPNELEQQIKILVLDDDKVIADMFGDLLSEKGRSVDVFYDGLSALKGIEKTLYDVIIVDLVLPEVGGLDILRFAKKINPDVSVIIITGYASLESAIMAIKEGAYDYITKPCRIEDIRIVVENAIEKTRLARENKELWMKLQAAYDKLMELKKERGEAEKIARINFFSSSMPSLQYLYKDNAPTSDHYIDKLQALSSLKERGVLTESEFETFKKHLLKILSL